MKTLTKLVVVLLTVASTAMAEPAKWQLLLDAKLSNFEVWIGVPHKSVTGLPEGTFQSDSVTKGTPMGLNNDPKKVFSVREDDGEPMLCISGEIYGGLSTIKEYENYHFSTLFKWGEKKWKPRLKKLRDSGILYHCTGEQGYFWSVWKSSIEYQVQETDLGDLYKLGGTGAEVRSTPVNKKIRKYDPQSEEYASKGRVNASSEPDAPHGEWNQLEIYAIGDDAVHVVNGVIVLVVENMTKDKKPLIRGQVQIQSEGAECYYKQMKIQNITNFPDQIRSKIRLKE